MMRGKMPDTDTAIITTIISADIIKLCSVSV